METADIDESDLTDTSSSEEFVTEETVELMSIENDDNLPSFDDSLLATGASNDELDSDPLLSGEL